MLKDGYQEFQLRLYPEGFLRVYEEDKLISEVHQVDTMSFNWRSDSPYYITDRDFEITYRVYDPNIVRKEHRPRKLGFWEKVVIAWDYLRNDKYA